MMHGNTCIEGGWNRRAQNYTRHELYTPGPPLKRCLSLWWGNVGKQSGKHRYYTLSLLCKMAGYTSECMFCELDFVLNNLFQLGSLVWIPLRAKVLWSWEKENENRRLGTRIFVPQKMISAVKGSRVCWS